ncbi:MAG: manganese efflux pump MntP family protein [Oscillospiraceae bacterium]
MSFFELLLVSVALAMDAFAVSMCKGLAMRTLNRRNAAIIALFFGCSQAVMPIVGWLLARSFERYITRFDHWVAFVLLTIIGINMIADTRKDDRCPDDGGLLNYRELLLLSFATSIDALAVGITLAFLNTEILSSACIIGVTTFAISFFGVCIGNRFGAKYKDRAQLIGGVVLIAIGVRILIDHLSA